MLFRSVSQSRYGPVDTDKIKNVDLFFYDGPDGYQHIYRAITKYKDCLADQSIIVIDDANWTDTTDAAKAAVKKLGLTVLYEKRILNSIESEKDWWNGVHVMVVAKTK